MNRYLLCSCLWTLSAFGQFRENTAPEMTCGTNQNAWKGYGHSCSITELKVPVTQRLDIEAGPNGGVSVKGWNRPEVWVRAKIDTGSKQGEAAAKDLAKLVTVEAHAGRIGAKGPSSNFGDQWWSVSFEIFVPHKMDLAASTVNGGVNLWDLEGQLRFRTTNGGVNLTRVAGDVQGRTTNGGVHVDLEGARWSGQGLDVTTTNGGVNLAVPAAYSANLRASTTRGGFTSDFGSPSREEQRGWARKEYDRILGNGGAPVKVSTTNGGVRIKKK